MLYEPGSPGERGKSVRKGRKGTAFGLSALLSFGLLCGCSSAEDTGVKTVELLNYKPEAVEVFEEIEQRFNDTHDDVKLKVTSPNQAMTILKTRLVREDYPEIVGIGGDINYSNFLDAGLFEDISDVEAIQDVKQAYLDMDKTLELIPQEGVYAMPFAANAAGILYNKDLFEEHGWQIPTTWDEFTALCEEIQSEGITPLYAGYKDSWTTLAPWNALAVCVADADAIDRVNRGESTFEEEYSLVADRIKDMQKYVEDNPVAYGYNDAASAFARGQSAMWAIGSYAIPQIRSVNPDMNIGSFVMPAGDDESQNNLNSGIDLQFSILKGAENKEEAKEVLNFLNSDEIVQLYLDAQGGIAAKEGDFAIPEDLADMKKYVDEGRMRDFPDHKYPSEMSVDALIQTYLMDDSDQAKETFLKKFDTDWQKYNRDTIRKLKEYEERQGSENE